MKAHSCILYFYIVIVFFISLYKIKDLNKISHKINQNIEYKQIAINILLEKTIVFSSHFSLVHTCD